MALVHGQVQDHDLVHAVEALYQIGVEAVQQEVKVDHVSVDDLEFHI